MKAEVAARWHHGWVDDGRSRWRTWGARELSFFAVFSSVTGLTYLEAGLWGDGHGDALVGALPMRMPERPSTAAWPCTV